MARLPIPGSDDDTWGSVLNSYLEVAHDASGNLLTSALQQAGGVTSVNGKTPSSGVVTLAASDVGAPTTLAGDSDVSITSPSNNQVLSYNSTSGKWVNTVSGTAPVSSVFTRTGAIVAASGDYNAAQVTNAADKSSASAQTFTGNVAAPAFVASGLTGAAAASRHVGATASGAPASGTFAVGDFVIDQTAAIWVCNAAGTPGTWVKLAGIDTTASDIHALGTQAAGSTGKAADAGHVHPTTGLVLQAGSSMGGYLAPAVVGLTFGSSIAVNAALGNVFAVTLTASTGQLANPTNPIDGQLIRFRITQGTTGSWTLTYGTAYDFGAASAPTLSTAAGKVDVLSFEYNAALTKWCYFGSGLGY